MAKDPNRPLDFLVLPVPILRQHISGLPAETLGILLQLLLRCAIELNSGRIDYAAATTNAPQVNIPGIWHWEGSTLVVDIYPADYEAKALAKRYTTAANAAARWEKSSLPQNGAHAIAYPETCNGMQKNTISHAASMQLHQKTCNGMQMTMPLHPCAHARGIQNNKFIEVGDISASAENTPPHPPADNPEFERWWRLIAATHPTGKLMRELPPDAHAAAWSAFQCIPAAEERAELLAAYMGSKLQCNKYGQRFWRASGIEHYFSKLYDHISHAERWAVETGYHRKAARAEPAAAPKPATAEPAAAPRAAPTTPPPQTFTEEELRQFFDDIKNPTPPQQPTDQET